MHNKFSMILCLLCSQITLQGFRGQNVFFNLALRERNIEVRLYLKVVLIFWDVDVLINRTNFQKSNLGWPLQPPTGKVQKLKNDISWFHWKNGFQNIKIKLNLRTWMTLECLAVIFQALESLWPHFPQKITEFYDSINLGTKVTYLISSYTVFPRIVYALE